MAQHKTLAEVRDKLRLSKLAAQTELLTTDLDLRELSMFNRQFRKPMRIEESVVAGTVHRTITGASTVDLTLNDRYGNIARSGFLGNKTDINIDGLWFRLVKVGKTGNQLQLTFESREVAVLRTYQKFRASKWGELTRARFIQILVNEVKEFHIPFVCPEMKYTPLEKKTEKQKAQERDVGLGNWKNAADRAIANGKPLSVKGDSPSSEQLKNIDTVLQVGMDHISKKFHKRKFMVCAIMTGIQEATAYNHPFGDEFDMSYPQSVRATGSVGFFQQMPGWGSFSQRMDLTYSARKFYDAAMAADKGNEKIDYNDLCQKVQGSAHPEAYGQWRIEAERFVTAFGIAGGDSTTDFNIYAANNMKWLLNQQGQTVGEQVGAKNQFMRGRPKEKNKPREKEDSWTCMQRLADEVQWRCFEVSGKIYFMSEPWLFKSAPRAFLTEESDGVDWIDYDYDIGKRNAQLTLNAHLDRWAGSPGSIIEIGGAGVSNGRWLVSDIDRSLFDDHATITLKKPLPVLPEPKEDEGIASIATAGASYTGDKTPPDNTPPDGTEPPLPDDLPNGKALRNAVINNKSITWTRGSQTQDIALGLIKPNLLKFMLAFTDAGFTITVTSMRSDHSYRANSGNVSLHSMGQAVDMGNFTDQTEAQTKKAAIWIRKYKLQLHIDELILHSHPELCLGGPYDQSTLNDHNDHIHVGVFA